MVKSILARTLCAFLVASATAASAAEIVVRNDVIPLFTTIYAANAANARLGSLLTLPTSGTLVGVQIVWDSDSGMDPPLQGAKITISDGITTPPQQLVHPGPTLATILSPVLANGVVNEFRYLDPGNNLVPLNVPVTAGKSLFIDLDVGTLGTNHSGIVGSVYRPGNPIPASIRNFTYIPGVLDENQFLALYLAGRDGDFGIRAIIEPVPEPSSCALAAVGIAALLAIKRRKPQA